VTHEEAVAGIGRIVIYNDGYGRREEGTLVDMPPIGDNARVRYSHNDCSIKSTPLDKLSFLGGP
jgi:hypothetical protein